MWLLRYLSFLDLVSYRFHAFRRDLVASATVTFLGIPQGVALTTDPTAPIFQRAHGGVVGDYSAVAPTLGEALKTITLIDCTLPAAKARYPDIRDTARQWRRRTPSEDRRETIVSTSDAAICPAGISAW